MTQTHVWHQLGFAERLTLTFVKTRSLLLISFMKSVLYSSSLMQKNLRWMFTRMPTDEHKQKSKKQFGSTKWTGRRLP
jgi:hypothetical protein